MTPIERVQRRAAAASLLNVSIYSTPEELAREWKRRAFMTHPDRNQGNDREFRAMQTAFEILLGTAADDVKLDDGSETPRIRPKRVVSRERSRTVRPA
jgi:hypothetical protein